MPHEQDEKWQQKDDKAGDSDATAGQPATIFSIAGHVTNMARTAIEKGLLMEQTKTFENGLWESR